MSHDNSDSHVRPIPQGYYGRLSPTPRKRSWGEAYKRFRSNSFEAKVMIFVARLCGITLGINVFDEPIPILGQFDDPFAPGQFTGFVITTIYVFLRVKHYRNPRR
jgi:hypothetical protein